MTPCERLTWDMLQAAVKEAEGVAGESHVEGVRCLAQHVRTGTPFEYARQAREYLTASGRQLYLAEQNEKSGHPMYAEKHLANSVLFEQVASAFDSLDRMLREPS